MFLIVLNPLPVIRKTVIRNRDIQKPKKKSKNDIKIQENLQKHKKSYRALIVFLTIGVGGCMLFKCSYLLATPPLPAIRKTAIRNRDTQKT